MEDMKIYEVTFKNGASRYYGFQEDCQYGETVVADTSHGPLLGRITDILSELPDYLDADKMRFILCRVPAVNEASMEIRKEQIKGRMAELDYGMDAFIEQERRGNWKRGQMMLQS